MKEMKKQKLVEIGENKVAQKGIKEKQKLNETVGKNRMDNNMIMRMEWMMKKQMIIMKMEWMMKMR
jgi:hypothetical protein